MSYSAIENKLKLAGFSISYRAPGELKLQSCPLHRDKTPSLSINVNKGRYHCFSCGDSGTIRKLLSYYGIGSYSSPDLTELEKMLEECAPKSIDSSLYKADIGELEGYRYYHPYLTSRGLSRGFILNNKIGFDKLAARVTIPIFLDGTYYGCAKRTVIDEQPKITYNSGMPKNEIVYKPLTSTGNSEYLLVVEGPIDALKSSYYNQDAIAILGCQPSAKQLEIAKRIANGRTIILALDNDNPGKRGIDKWVEMMLDIDATIMVYPDGVKDIGEMNEQQFNDSLKNSILFWEYAN